MKKKYLLIIVVVLAAGWYFFGRSGSLLGSDPKVFLYTINGASTGQLNVTIPFTKAKEGAHAIDIGVDLDGNGEISDAEWQVKDFPTFLVQNLKNNYLLADTEKKLKPGSEVLVKIGFKKAGSDKPAVLEKKVKVESFEIAEMFGFDVDGANQDLKRGIGFPQGIISIAQADGDEVFRDANTPDLGQNSMECAAVSAANSLMSLAGQHDKLENLPKFTGELIEELKTDMKFKKGILLPNMVAGKNAFAQRHNLPVSTEIKYAPTKEDILKALNSGAAVELSFSFVQSRSGRDNTGHVVTLVGGSSTNLFVHDSGTPEGMDTLRMFGTVQTPRQIFINVPYPLWDGTAFIDAIVIQNWTDPERANESYTDGGEQGSEIEVLVINGHYFPKSFFRVGGHQACDANHYHAVNPDNMAYGLKSKTSTEIVSMADPNPSSCGFGKVSEVKQEKITINFEQSQALVRYLPN